MFTQFGAAKYKFSFTTASQTAAVAAAAIELATGLAPQELQISSEPEFVAEADGADGTVDAVAVAQDKRSFTLTGYITDMAKFNEEGLDFTFDGRFYIITGRQATKATKDFQKGQLTGSSWNNITAETP